MDVKKNRCVHCQTLFTPAFRHPHQTCCGGKKCVLAGRAKLQKKKMEKDPDYRENQKLSNQKWLEKNPDYFKKYRNKNPDSTTKNRMMQQIRNLKRTKIKSPAVKVNLDELVAKMHLVNRAQPEQQISLWLLSTTAEIRPIKVILASKSVRYDHLPGKGLPPVQMDNRNYAGTKELI
jgi:hypothetical protein